MSDISVHAIANGVQIMVEIQRQIIILYGSLPSRLLFIAAYRFVAQILLVLFTTVDTRCGLRS